MTPDFPRRIEGLEEPSEAQTKTLIALDREDLSSFSVEHDHNEQFGLFPVHVPTPHNLASLPAAHEIDIIAVHGLGGDVHRTWQHENGFNWLDHIHEEFPGIRVYSYGYDSGMAFTFGTVGLTNYARHLLSLIKRIRNRTSRKERKIVFICHSLGGLLVKQALMLSHNERGMFGTILESTSAVLFFATPHSGTYSEPYEDILSRVGLTLLFPTSPDELLEHYRLLYSMRVQKSVPGLRLVADAFIEHAYHIPVSSFVEDTPLPGLTKVLVNQGNAKMNLPREHVIPMLDHDHRQICKYPSTDSKGMRLVLDELKRAIGLATTTPVDGVTGAAQLATNTAKRLREGNLLRAVVTGDLGAVSRLIQSGINCDVYDSNHNTALHIACQQNHLDIGIYLLQHGAPVNARNDYEDHPLHLAVKNCVGLVLAIIEHGGDLNAQNIDGNTPLHHAASAGDTHLVTQLLEHGADWSIRNEANESPARLARKALKLDAMKALHHAAEKSQQVMVLASVDRRVAGDDLTRDEQQAVSATRSLPSASFLSMDMDVEIKKQASELATAARRGDLAAVEDMLDNGVKPTPHVLYLAADGCRSDVVEILVDIMEDIDSGVGWAGNALCAAACRADGHNTLRVLLEKGADINWQGGTYGCALQAATVNYRLENVKLLLMYGADVHAQCGHYGNALTAAARHRTSFEDMATLLLELGVDIDAQGPGVYGNALQTAVYKFHVPNVKFLLHHGANAKVQGRFGSAIDIARRNLTKDGYIGNREEKEEILFLLTEDELDSLAIID